MRKQRRIRKEDIGDPSNFVHIKHVGFGQRSFDLGGQEDQASAEDASKSISGGNDEFSGEQYQVERRNKGHRSSLIPRHHRSTTTGIFPPENPYSLSRGNNASIESHRESIDSPGNSSDTKSSLKPTFGSLLNLSFLPLGLGKSSSKSPSIGKTKRMSLLNLTAGSLFANPKAYEENRESVHMTGYIRRRSSSTNSNDENNDNEIPPVKPAPTQNATVDSDNTKKLHTTQTQASNPSASSRIPLAKLGRSKSTMAEFSKRPKLRLKIVPPPQPPPGPPTAPVKINIEAEALPSPPPSPIPSPPPSPVPATPPSFLEETVALRRNANFMHRPRIIPLPSTSSVDSPDPPSPQYLTPAGGCSPVPNNESTFSPTIPPFSTPFFPTSSRNTPGTPPVWPLQPAWPTTLPMQMKEATIPEIPSPCKEEMETEASENEYAPVLSIVESFMFSDHQHAVEPNAGKTDENSVDMNGDSLPNAPCYTVSSSNIEAISNVLCENIDYTHWPRIAEKLFHITQKVPSKDDIPCSTSRENDIYRLLLEKTLELWSEKAGNEAVVEKLATILQEENHHRATEALQDVLQNMKM